MSCGRVAATDMSQKKVNTRSSTELDLVGVNDYITCIIWVYLFVKEKCFTHKTKIMHQYKRNATHLGINGKSLSGQRARNMIIMHLFIKDMVDKGWVKIIYCATGGMVDNHYIKTLQGIQFKRFHAFIINRPIKFPI